MLIINVRQVQTNMFLKLSRSALGFKFNVKCISYRPFHLKNSKQGQHLQPKGRSSGKQVSIPGRIYLSVWKGRKV